MNLSAISKNNFFTGEKQDLSIYLLLVRDTRSVVLEESLRKLGVEKLSKDDVQKMAWEVLEAKIGNWIHFMRIAVSIENLMLNFFLVASKCITLLNYRSNYCLLEKEKCVIKYLKALNRLEINPLQRLRLVVCLCYSVLGRRLLKARGHQKSYLYFWTCMK